MNLQLTKSRPLWSSVFWFALGAALFKAVENTIDSVVNQNYAISPDKLTAASSYLLVGGWFGVVVCVCLGLGYGKLIKIIGLEDSHEDSNEDDTTTHSRFSPRSLAILAGVLGALTTLISLWGYQLNDLGVMVALTNVYILVVVGIESINGTISLRSLALPSLLIVVSVIMVAYSVEWRTNVSILLNQAPSLVIILVLYSVTNGLASIVSKSAVDKSNPVSIQVIRFIALAVSGTVLSIGLAIGRNQLPELLATSLIILLTPEVWILLFALFVTVFVGQVMELAAKKRHINVSEIVGVQSITVGIGFLTALVINRIHSGFVGPVPTDTETLVVRIFGAVGLAIALMFLQKNMKRANKVTE